jgi:hypothetical protein
MHTHTPTNTHTHRKTHTHTERDRGYVKNFTQDEVTSYHLALIDFVFLLSSSLKVNQPKHLTNGN